MCTVLLKSHNVSSGSDKKPNNYISFQFWLIWWLQMSFGLFEAIWQTYPSLPYKSAHIDWSGVSQCDELGAVCFILPKWSSHKIQQCYLSPIVLVNIPQRQNCIIPSEKLKTIPVLCWCLANVLLALHVKSLLVLASWVLLCALTCWFMGALITGALFNTDQ